MLCKTINKTSENKMISGWMKAENVSLPMPGVLFAGLALWVIYGILKEGWIIIISNAVSMILKYKPAGYPASLFTENTEKPPLFIKKIYLKFPVPYMRQGAA